MQGIHKRLSENQGYKALMGDEDRNDGSSEDSGQKAKSNESMFGSDVNRKGGKPIKGYRWMCFTFFMIFLLCIMVFFHHTINNNLADLMNGCNDQELTLMLDDGHMVFEGYEGMPAVPVDQRQDAFNFYENNKKYSEVCTITYQLLQEDNTDLVYGEPNFQYVSVIDQYDYRGDFVVVDNNAFNATFFSEEGTINYRLRVRTNGRTNSSDLIDDASQCEIFIPIELKMVEPPAAPEPEPEEEQGGDEAEAGTDPLPEETTDEPVDTPPEETTDEPVDPENPEETVDPENPEETVDPENPEDVQERIERNLMEI